MAEVICFVEGRDNHNSFSNTCRLEDITITDDTLTAAGFLPQCGDFTEKEQDGPRGRRKDAGTRPDEH